MPKVIKIGVRDLVEHLFRSGDLNFDVFAQSTAVAGIRAHQRIQMKRPAHYQPEVNVSVRHHTPQYTLEIAGRIDGVLHQDKTVVVEEIKTSSKKMDHLTGYQNPVHWGQLKTYAHIYAKTHALSQIVGQLTYVHPHTWQERSFEQTFSAAELNSFFSDMIQQYLKWADHHAAWQQTRTQSIQALGFPFAEYRPGQRQMAVAVFRTLIRHGKIFVQAPTGIGKTMATIFPAIKALGQESLGMLFYLTARTTGRIAAENVFNLLRKKGLRFKIVTLTAKDKICFEPQNDCNPEACPFAKGYYDRRNDALWSGLTVDALNREKIEAVAKEFSICPFEFSLDISKWSDGIICDYNYAFDPRVYLRRYFSQGQRQHILLVDEAHNLAERSREMFSAQIAKKPLLDLRRLLKADLQSIYRCLTRINRWFLTIAKTAPEDTDQWSHKLPPSDLVPLLTQFVQNSEKWLRLNIRRSFRNSLLEQYFTAVVFLRVLESFDDSYAVCYTKIDREVIVRLFCIDPSQQLAQALKRGVAIVFFSATLTPLSYFQSLFGCGPQTDSLSLPSPFPDKNFALFRVDHISTYFRHREDTSQMLCQLLLTFTTARKGNYLLFFPSYSYLKMIVTLFAAAQPDLDIIIQTPMMSDVQRRLFLSRFQAENDRTLVGFAVLGGIFGEGIDLVGDRLCGAAVVGVGLPGICPERELIREYYGSKNALGFEFAYQFPGINRVLQAAGRVIRTESDRGAVLLIDPRFARPRYASLLPNYWHPVRINNSDRFRAGLIGFWQSV